DYIGKEIINPRDKKYRDEIIEKIIKTDLNKNHNYLYSDFGFILLARMVEEITKMDLDEYLDENFYKPMDLKNLTYNPIYKFDIKRIAPTENDTYYRNRLIQGSVHDQTADLMGGVAGHAGLFGNAIDVASVLEMLLNNGEYKGVNYLEKSTIEEFNKRHFKNNRRGLGFDKPLIKGVSPFCSKYASQESYGHSGFTGTYFWSDPDKEISFVFLSNRVYPNANNGLLSKFNIRTDINDLIYESLNQGEETKREDEK
ncbi:MAG: serine hydrolase, partial [Bacteroidales bacterium]|nr:serine hydrolase [Bacteroidales bacterium]